MLRLKIVTPKGALESCVCDSVRLTESPDISDKGGGSIGIRTGHIPSFISLAEGSVCGLLNGRSVLSGKSGDGFATVENDAVTVTVEYFLPNE